MFSSEATVQKTGRFGGLEAPSQETGLEKFSNASSGLRSGESFLWKFLCHPRESIRPRGVGHAKNFPFYRFFRFYFRRYFIRRGRSAAGGTFRKYPRR